MLVILHRLKQFSSADVASLRTELVELCGENLLDVVAVIINNRETLSAEFQVLIVVLPRFFFKCIFVFYFILG
jgi:hypothetical protein